MAFGNIMNPGCGCCGPGGGGGGTTVSIPNCFCAPSPGTLTLTSADLTYFPSATLRGTTSPGTEIPACPGWNGTAGVLYISTTTETDPATGDDFYYFVGCTFNQWTLFMVWPGVNPNGPPCFKSGAICQWLTPGGGNSCSSSSLSFTNGTMYAGAPLTAGFTLHS